MTRLKGDKRGCRAKLSCPPYSQGAPSGSLLPLPPGQARAPPPKTRKGRPRFPFLPLRLTGSSSLSSSSSASCRRRRSASKGSCFLPGARRRLFPQPAPPSEVAGRRQAGLLPRNRSPQAAGQAGRRRRRARLRPGKGSAPATPCLAPYRRQAGRDKPRVQNGFAHKRRLERKDGLAALHLGTLAHQAEFPGMGLTPPGKSYSEVQ